MAKRDDYRDPYPTEAEVRERDAQHLTLEQQVFAGQLHWTALVKPGVPVDCGCTAAHECYMHRG